MDRKEGLEDVARRVREVLADDPDAGDELRRTRSAVLGMVERRKPASPFLRSSPLPRRSLLLAFSASVAAGAAALWIWTRPPTFEIGEARPGGLGDVVEATDGRVVPVSFSDGSALVLRDGGRIRVLTLDAAAARVLVEEGVVDASVVHRQARKTRWEFEVGPYRVTVTGTKFRIAFRAGDGSLRVSTEVGQVVVAGGCMEAPATVGAGESLETSCAPRRGPAADEAALVPAAPLDATPTVKLIQQPNQIERWRQSLAAGRLLEGLRAAERAGFDQVCRVATEKELLALADAGRFFGPPKRAVSALTALRQRFPASLDAGTAAFTLGRIAFESDHDYGKAAGWFETYMQEQPRGPLMGDAFGRLMEARLHSGDGAGARASAQQYLRRFPGGPYSSEARGILSK
jgi:hypothetical protein